MKKMITVLTVAVVMLSPVFSAVVRAQDDAGKAKSEQKGDHARPELKDMTVSGKIAKEDMPGRDGKTSPHFVLTTADGAKVMLNTRHHAKEGDDKAAAPEIKLDEYVGKDVTVTGQGFERDRDGKKMTVIVKITKVDAAAAAK